MKQGDTRDKDKKAVQDAPAKSLLRNWGRKMAQGRARAIPVFVEDEWSFHIVRGNKRVLQVPFKLYKN